MNDLVATIIPDNISAISYHQAAALRAIAEESDEPEAYERAANAFDSIGMKISAEACMNRANHYRGIQEDL